MDISLRVHAHSMYTKPVQCYMESYCIKCYATLYSPTEMIHLGESISMRQHIIEYKRSTWRFSEI